jgi:amidase
MRFDEYIQHDALGLAALVRQGEVSALALLDIAQARMEATHPALNAVIRRLDERARHAAHSNWRSDQPFAGVPFLIKDLMQDIAGVPSACGGKVTGRLPAPETADVTRRWEDAGLVIFGMTNTPEFGSKGVTEPLAFGPTHNPWDLSRTTGGSSGGSAAAVAAGIVPVAGANDGGGSIRIPAGACGLFGLKPGRGRVPTGPMVAEGMNGAISHGVISRSVRDSAAMLDVLQGTVAHGPYPMPGPSTPYLSQIQRPPRALRVGFCTASPIGTPVHADAVAAVQDAAQLLASLGHHVEEAEPAIDGLQLAEDFSLSWFCLVAAMVEHACVRFGATLADFEPDTRAMVAAGRSMSAMELTRAQLNWHTHTRALADFHQRFDVLLTPTISEAALPIGQLATPPQLSKLIDLARVLGLSGVLRKTPQFRQQLIANLSWTPFTQLANLTGRPAMSVPLYWTPQGLPLGVQFVAGLEGEGLLLQLAAQLEQARPWFMRLPDVPVMPAGPGRA